MNMFQIIYIIGPGIKCVITQNIFYRRASISYFFGNNISFFRGKSLWLNFPPITDNMIIIIFYYIVIIASRRRYNCTYCIRLKNAQHRTFVFGRDNFVLLVLVPNRIELIC